METSIFLARLIGPVMLTVGLAVLFNRQEFRALAQDFISSRALLFLSGLVMLPAGLAIVLVHNIWVADGRTMVTLFGWTVTLTSALRLLAPQYVAARGSAMLQRPRMPLVAGTFWTLAGLLFCIFGFRHS
jgi:hypothetical protein